MNYSIEPLGVEASQTASLVKMLQEMQAHYGVPCPSTDGILKGLKERPDGTEIIVAMDQSTVAGFAAFSSIYPGPFLQPGLFLKELYVRSAYRGHGIGRDLLVYLARLAKDRGLSRIDWTADANDERLLRFYDSIGGEQKPGKIFYRLDGDALKCLVT